MTEELTPWEPPVHIYVLRDPVTKRIRYVGQTRHPATRLQRHLMEAKPNSLAPREQWVYSLKQDGQKPEFCIVEAGTLSSGPALEKKWIAHFAEAGEPLSLEALQDHRDRRQKRRHYGASP